MRVSHSEGLANHTVPESCVGPREGAGEASAGEHTGQPLSRESLKISGADVVAFTEGNMDGRVSASAPPDPTWSKTLACADALCTGTGRSHGWPTGTLRVLLWSASGRRGAVADDARS